MFQNITFQLNGLSVFNISVGSESLLVWSMIGCAVFVPVMTSIIGGGHWPTQGEQSGGGSSPTTGQHPGSRSTLQDQHSSSKQQQYQSLFISASLSKASGSSASRT